MNLVTFDARVFVKTVKGKNVVIEMPGGETVMVQEGGYFDFTMSSVPREELEASIRNAKMTLETAKNQYEALYGKLP